ncbi:MAG: oligosaccharide flippase family protein [Bacteroidales bacterium]|nr:oligosaccharide flippase family protein [Bacteroidales bacterium]
MSEKNQIAKGAIISYISIFVNIAISLVYTPWMIHKVGVSDYGLYSLVGAFLSYFMLDFGLAGAITRFVAKYRAEGNEKKVENLLGLTAKVYLAIDAVIFLVITILYFFLTDIFKGLTPEELEKLKVLYIISGTFSILSFAFKPVSGAMMAYEYFVANKMLDLVVRIGTVVFIVIALLLDGNIFHIVFITGATGFTVALIRYGLLMHKAKLKLNWRYFHKGELKELFSYSVWVLVRQMAQMFRLSLVPTILGIVSTTTEIAIFSVGRNLEGFVYTFSAALNGLFLPKVTRLAQTSDRTQVMRLMVRVGRIQLYIITLIIFGFAIFGGSFISLWVGQEFEKSFWVLLFLVMSNLSSLTLAVAMDVIYAENKIRYSSLTTIITSIIGLVFAFILAPKMGAVGCALAAGCGLLLNEAVMIWFYHTKMHLDMGYFFKNCHLKILPALAVYSVGAYFLSKMVTINSWMLLFACIGAYTIIYVAIVYFFLFNKDEKSLVMGLIPSKFKKH